MIIDNFVSHHTTSPLRFLLPGAGGWRGRAHSSQSVIRSVHPILPCILGRAVNKTSRKFSLMTRDTAPGPASSLWAEYDDGGWWRCEGWGKVKFELHWAELSGSKSWLDNDGEHRAQSRFIMNDDWLVSDINYNLILLMSDLTRILILFSLWRFSVK